MVKWSIFIRSEFCLTGLHRQINYYKYLKSFKRNIVLLYLVVFFTAIFAYAYFNLFELLVGLSPRHEIKQHFLEKVKLELIVFYFLVIITFLIFAYILPYLKNHFSVFKKFAEKMTISSGILRKILFVALGVYIFTAPLFVLYSLDVGTDESTYVYTGQHYYNFNKFMIKFDNENYQIPKDMFLQNIPLVILRPFMTYSVYLIRYVTYFYSMMFVIILFLFFRKSYSTLSSLLFLTVIASYSGFVFLSGTSFGENSALLFSLISIYLFSKYYETKKSIGLHLSALLLALSIITK